MAAGNDGQNQLRNLGTDLFPPEQRRELADMLHRDVEARCRSVNQQDVAAWFALRSRADWEAFRDQRIDALLRSLGPLPPIPEDLRARVTRTFDGNGFRIENTLFESRPGVPVAGNLYLPASPSAAMPAILIIHSHHNPRTQGELVDMGMTWARQGCAVLVIDQLSYGERRQHPHGPRQDYRFRYINGAKLHLVGESLMGWMVHDTRCALELLLRRGDIDRQRVVLIGAVAGGGDPAAVVAALDARVTCAAPFNFGGPQPESPYPLPEDAEKSFNYMGWGYWESTRSLRLSARDGFLPWVIVGAIAPRGLIYAHEFSWDRERDPVWQRLQRIYAWYGAEDRLGFAHGAGLVTGHPPEATHCNNVGPVHRRMIYAELRKILGLSPPEEYGERPPEEALLCLPPGAEQPEPVVLHELYARFGAALSAVARQTLAQLDPQSRAARRRQLWTARLGAVEPIGEPTVRSQTVETHNGLPVGRIVLEVESGIAVPLLLLRPPHAAGKRTPLVVGVAQAGKGWFVEKRAAEIAGLLEQGIALCLPDLRGTGESDPGEKRQRLSRTTNLSVTEWMHGQTLLGSRLHDLRAVLAFLRTRDELDTKRVGLWGDSAAPVNPPDFIDPFIEEEDEFHLSEPLGGLLALFGALYEEGVRAVIARGTLAGYGAVLRDRFCYVPHDILVPDPLGAGDLGDVAAGLAPLPISLEALVDGRDCLLPPGEVEELFAPALEAYRGAAERFSILPECRGDLAGWFGRWLA